MNDSREFLRHWFPDEMCPTAGFHRALAAHLPTVGTLLDLGCGDNSLLTRYRDGAYDVWGTDFNEHPDLKHPWWYRPLRADGTISFPAATFDLVASHMVMEHVSEPARFLAEVARVLKPGGVFVGHSIHARHYVTWIRRLFNCVPHRWVQRLVKALYGREEHDTFPTCYRLYSRKAIGWVAAETNLQWEAWHGHANQGYFVFSPMLFRNAIRLDWSLEQVLPGAGKIYFTVVLRKPTDLAPVRVERMSHSLAD